MILQATYVLLLPWNWTRKSENVPFFWMTVTSSLNFIVIETKYHAACLVKLYNSARPLQKQCSDATDSSSVELEELAFAELIGYIEECLEQEAPGLLTLSELVKFYQCKLKEVGVEKPMLRV